MYQGACADESSEQAIRYAGAGAIDSCVSKLGSGN